MVYFNLEPDSFQTSCKADGGNTNIVNSALYGNVTIGDKTVVSCCKIRGNVTIGKDCYVAGLKVENLKVKDHAWFIGQFKENFYLTR